MKLKILSPIICRTPLFPYTEKLENVWEELKEAIELSSTDLYEQIKDTSYADYDKLNPKIKFACWKYFNRARYRSTPFGLFGSITPVPLSVNGDDNQLIISKEIKRHEFIDWSNKDYLLGDIDNLFAQASFFLSNSTIYTCGDQLRYISITEGTFEISGIESQPVIKSVLDFCQEQQSKEAVLDYLTNGLKLQLAVGEDLLKQLIALQLMITDIHPNIIGTDYFERMKVKPDTDSKPYLIAERKLVKGQIDPKTLKVISEAILFLKDHLPVQKSQALENFKQQFQRKFEYREVPLLMALDPELGVGYDGLEMASLSSPLIDYLKERNQSKDTSSEIAYTPLHQFILNKIFQNEEINLEEFDGKTNTNVLGVKIPNTFSAIVQFNGQQIILEQAGGCTANALLGRFTLASNEIETHCKNIIRTEREANPNVFFVDIGYKAEKNVDNVNRRMTIYDHELSILTYPSTKEQLLFDDLLVSVRDNEVLLRSGKHNKRILPRLASAYNYTQSDLSIYRFLADLQNQHLQTNVSIQIRNLFPDLEYYPQINYKNIILSPKMWRVPKKFHAEASIKNPDLDELKIWLEDQRVSHYFKCGNLDKHLYFKYYNDEDLKYFLKYCMNKDLLYISEAFLPEETTIKNEKGQPYLPQFIISLGHSASIYSPLGEDKLKLMPRSISMLLPGEEWLYFEIYMHPLRSDNFLTTVLPDFLKEIKSLIKDWFFINYNFPSAHIRLRLQIKSKSNLSELVSKFSDLLRKDIKDGIVTDLQIKPYVREIERYSVKHIEQIEAYFGYDSRYALRVRRMQYDNSSLHLFTIHFINNIFTQINFNVQEQLVFIKNIANKFVIETSIDTLGFKKMNEMYEHLTVPDRSKIAKETKKRHQIMAMKISKLINNTEQDKRLQLLTDIIHMHINRLFATDHRMHELIIYQYLLKYLMAQKNRLKN